MNVPGFENDTPLHDAVANGHAHVAQLLLERGANPSLRWVCLGGGVASTDWCWSDLSDLSLPLFFGVCRNRRGQSPRDLIVGEQMASIFSAALLHHTPLVISPSAIQSPHMNMPVKHYQLSFLQPHSHTRFLHAFSMRMRLRLYQLLVWEKVIMDLIIYILS